MTRPLLLSASTAATLALIVAGCGGPSTTGPGPGTGTGTSQETVAASAPASPAVPAFPAELVGVWSGDSDRGPLTFTADGRFRTNTSSGSAAVQDRTMVMTVDGQRPMTMQWAITSNGGVLELGDTTYLRDDARSDNAFSLVGYWLSVRGYASLRFGADGTYTSDNPSAKKPTIGRYTLSGPRLTLTSPSTSAEYVITVGTFLTLSDPNGTVVDSFTRAG